MEKTGERFKYSTVDNNGKVTAPALTDKVLLHRPPEGMFAVYNHSTWPLRTTSLLPSSLNGSPVSPEQLLESPLSRQRYMPEDIEACLYRAEIKHRHSEVHAGIIYPDFGFRPLGKAKYPISEGYFGEDPRAQEVLSEDGSSSDILATYVTHNDEEGVARTEIIKARNLMEWDYVGRFFPDKLSEESRRIASFFSQYRNQWHSVAEAVQNGKNRSLESCKDVIFSPRKLDNNYSAFTRFGNAIQVAMFPEFSTLQSQEWWDDWWSKLPEHKVLGARDGCWWEPAIPGSVGTGDVFELEPGLNLMLYHAISGTDDSRVYRNGLALLLYDGKTWKEVARTDEPILEPTTKYEKEGQVPNVSYGTSLAVKECGQGDQGTIVIDFGGADSCMMRTKGDWQPLRTRLGSDYLHRVMAGKAVPNRAIESPHLCRMMRDAAAEINSVVERLCKSYSGQERQASYSISRVS